MPEIRVEIPDLPRLVDALKKWPDIAAPILDKAIKKSIYDVQARTIMETPIKTGRLRGSFQTAFSPLVGILRPTVEYAVHVHQGTRAHVIRPSTAKALYWPGAAHPVRVVNHPGTRPNPFMQRGLSSAQQTVMQNFTNALNEITRRVAEKV